MAAASTDKLRKWSRKWVGQIGAAGVSDASVVTIPLASSTNLPTTTGITLVIDRVDSAGALTPTLEETIVGVVSGANIVTAVRGVEGTAQSHAAGAVVELLVTATEHNDLIDHLLVEHNQDGTHLSSVVTTLTGTQTLTNKTLTSPKIGTNIKDTNGNELITLTATGSAVNEITYANAATGNAPSITASGDDTNIDLTLKGKGSGNVKLGTALLKFPNADGSANQALVTNGSGTLSFAASGQATVIAPNTVATNDGGGTLTTSGTTELTLITKTITNPSTAGQILVTANFNIVQFTVANDEFILRLYGPDGAIKAYSSVIPSGTTQRFACSLCWQGAVANSGTQTMTLKAIRVAGTGTASFESGKQSLTWTIFPGASTTA